MRGKGKKESQVASYLAGEGEKKKARTFFHYLPCLDWDLGLGPWDNRVARGRGYGRGKLLTRGVVPFRRQGIFDLTAKVVLKHRQASQMTLFVLDDGAEALLQGEEARAG